MGYYAGDGKEKKKIRVGGEVKMLVAQSCNPDIESKAGESQAKGLCGLHRCTVTEPTVWSKACAETVDSSSPLIPARVLRRIPVFLMVHLQS